MPNTNNPHGNPQSPKNGHGSGGRQGNSALADIYSEMAMDSPARTCVVIAASLALCAFSILLSIGGFTKIKPLLRNLHTMRASAAGTVPDGSMESTIIGQMREFKALMGGMQKLVQKENEDSPAAFYLNSLTTKKLPEPGRISIGSDGACTGGSTFALFSTTLHEPGTYPDEDIRAYAKLVFVCRDGALASYDLWSLDGKSWSPTLALFGKPGSAKIKIASNSNPGAVRNPNEVFGGGFPIPAKNKYAPILEKRRHIHPKASRRCSK